MNKDWFSSLGAVTCILVAGIAKICKQEISHSSCWLHLENTGSYDMGK